MDAKPSIGGFILEAAECGLKAASLLSNFAPSVKSKDIAAKISLSATLLAEIGKEVNQNATCFKENFQSTFENFPRKCKQQYQQILTAVEKASSFPTVHRGEGTETTAQKPWKRFLSALDMDKDKFKDFQESLNQSWERVLMLQRIVSLIVLQIRAQQHEPLTPSEYNRLGQLKKGLGSLLEKLRYEEIVSLVAFGLVNLTNPGNAAQLIEAAKSAAQEESLSRDYSSIASSSATVIDSPAQEVPLTKPETAIRDLPQPSASVPIVPRSWDDDEYEMYRICIKTHEKEKTQTSYRFLGIPGIINRGWAETEIVASVDKIPSSLKDIKAFIEEEKDSEYTVPPSMNDMINVSPKISTAIYNLVNEKNTKPSPYPRRQWSTEFLVNWVWWESKRFGRKQKKTEGYIVILRGERWFPPPPPNWPGSQPVRVVDVTSSKAKKDMFVERVVAQIELTQQETEKVMNDFLATFSTLYDGIPVEERGAAMRGIDMEEIDKLCDYDSDDSDDSSSLDSGSSRSLVDD